MNDAAAVPHRHALVRPTAYVTGLPLWARVLIWAGITAATVSGAPPDPARRIWTGVVMAIASLAMLFPADGLRYRRAVAVTVASAASIAGIVLAPGGIAEVPLFMAATLIPTAFSGAAMWVFVVVDAIAADLAIAWVSHSLAGLLAGFGIPLLVQRSIAQRELVAERDRAQALLTEVQATRDAETHAAALRERGRIAREMHDVLAHSLAGLSLQLQAARAVAAKAGAGAEVLEPLSKAATLARDGLAEARSAVGALRDPVGLGPDALPELVGRFPGDAHLVESGAPEPISGEAGHALYRAVQEALTNAARYAPGAPVRVSLTWSPGTVTAEVADDGPPTGHEPVPGQGTGLGLAGMAERVEEAGGALHAGPDGDRGWRVRVEFATRTEVEETMP